jgi:hypothetical protein
MILDSAVEYSFFNTRPLHLLGVDDHQEKKRPLTNPLPQVGEDVFLRFYAMPYLLRYLRT